MHLTVGILLGLVIAFYLVAVIIAVIEIRHAPMGYEDEAGFHELGTDREERDRDARHLPRINRRLPLGGLS